MEWGEVQQGAAHNVGCTVGPQSVGLELTKALASGGQTCTATDVAVLLCKMEFGDRELVRAGEFCSRCMSLKTDKNSSFALVAETSDTMCMTSPRTSND